MKMIIRTVFKRSVYLCGCAVVFAGASLAFAESERGGRPNILFIHMEDMGCEIPPYGDMTQKTPNLSRLAEQGMVFDRVNVTAASCALSRGSLFSGLYPHQNGIWGFVDTHGWHYRKEVITYIELLGKAGYRTGLTYKTGLAASDKSKVPFDLMASYNHNPYIKGTNPYKVSNCIDHFKKFLETQPKGKPFYFQAQTNDTHNDWDRPEMIRGMETTHGLKPVDPSQVKASNFPNLGNDIQLTPKFKKYLAGYYGAIQRVDYYVGEILSLLEKFGHTDNTLVIFSSDHGPSDINNRGKVTSYEHGVRVPFIVKWPGVVKPKTRSDALVSFVDLYPTFCAVAGADVPDYLPGYSLVPVFDGRKPDGVRKYLFTAYNAHGTGYAMLYPGRTINDGRFKLIHHLMADGKTPRGKTKYGGYPYKPHRLKDSIAASGSDSQAADIVRRTVTPPPLELYDLQNDPGETVNLAGDRKYKSVLKSLQAELGKWRVGTDDPLRDPKVLDEFIDEWLRDVDVYFKVILEKGRKALLQEGKDPSGLKRSAIVSAGKGVAGRERWCLNRERWIDASDPSNWIKDPGR